MSWLRQISRVSLLISAALFFFLNVHGAQQPDGRIVFAANEAKAGGVSAPDPDATEITWRGAGTVSWDYKPTRWGMYDLHLVNTCRALTEPVPLRVELAGMRLQAQVINSPQSDVFQTSRIARVYLPKSEPFTLALKAAEFPGDAMLKLRSVILAPAPEGVRIAQEGGRITLAASNAITHSVMMRYEPATNKNCLGYWTNPNDAAEWKFHVTKPGSFKIELWQGCGKGQGGSEVLVEVVGKTGRIKEARFVVEDTGHFQNFVPRDLGEVTFEDAGEYSLWVRPQNKKAAAVLDIRQIILAARDSAAVEGGAAGLEVVRSNLVRIATFDIDATPPVGSHMAYDPVTNKWDLGLRARGIVLQGAELPIVLCAVDWIGIANEGHDAFRAAIAEAAGTTRVRVAVHALHQHDAPDCDFSAEKILKEAGMDARQFEGSWQREVLTNLAAAVRSAVTNYRAITHLGLGAARVEKVASNRRVFGADGKVRTRYTACTDEELRAAEEGVIDPELSLVSFWDEDEPVAVLSYYATHPQSYYRTGIANPDFPGLARFFRQLRLPDALHVHFNGAGGNVGAGKYNDGARTNRLILAERMEEGMRRAWEGTKRERIAADDLEWTVEEVALPPAKHLSIEEFEAELVAKDPKLTLRGHASRLAWLRRCQEGKKVEVGSLRIGRARILHMPGELFVEYQLAAKKMRPDLFVAMAAYGDYAPWYIGTAVAYEEGGYETRPDSSNVAPETEAVLLAAMEKLLKEEPRIDTNKPNGKRAHVLPLVANRSCPELSWRSLSGQ